MLKISFDTAGVSPLGLLAHINISALLTRQLTHGEREDYRYTYPSEFKAYHAPYQAGVAVSTHFAYFAYAKSSIKLWECPQQRAAYRDTEYQSCLHFATRRV